MHLTYFPLDELPSAPSERFRDLFLVSTRWRAVDLVHFLADIAPDAKERDKLLMKHAKATTDKEGETWYTSKGGNVM